MRFAPGGLAGSGAFVRETTAARRVLVVSDSRVAPLYAAATLRSLRRSGLHAALAVIPSGERSKRVELLARLWKLLAREEIDRGDCLVALGGGVVGDLAGFAAATWLRGVRWVAIPTTLLAQVDSSVGGKTAIDLAEGKNLAGAFHQPAGVLVDTETLATLPARHVRAGLAEVVKMGMAVDAPLFRLCERRLAALASGQPRALAEAAERAVRAKARVVTRDEREAGARTALNFGHTAGHALEAALGYRRVIHGEAVAIGMRVAARLSVSIAGLPDREARRLEQLLDGLGLPSRMPQVPVARLMSALRLDKKRTRGETRWVLTPRVGFASVPRLISGRLIRAALLAAGARG
ncbi:MAG: 3-dehydroquinate synthase [Candidatus Eisenbacteria bacterium]